MMVLKSSLMPVGRGPRAWEIGPLCSRKKETEDVTSWDRESRYAVCRVGGKTGTEFWVGVKKASNRRSSAGEKDLPV